MSKKPTQHARPQRRVSSFTPAMSPRDEEEEQKPVQEKKTKAKRATENGVGKNFAGNKGPRAQYDKEAEKKFDAMLAGNMDNLPRLPRSIVRIFLSSTFSDTRAERNALARTAYPRLRDYCSEVGMDFQVVDLRWGVAENSQNDHSAEDICLQEVANCQQLSLGPNFVGFLSHRYGGRHPPPRVEVGEMEVVRAEAKALSLPDQELLHTWYRLDSNAVPPVFMLQPVRTQFTFYADFSPGCDELRKRDTEAWLATAERLAATLRQAADSALKKGNMTPAARRKYFCSVTEQEMEAGIVKASKPRDHCLLYQRDIRGLEGTALADKMAFKYVETNTVNGKVSVDLEVQKLRTELQGGPVTSLLGQSNRRVYTVPWVAGGVDPANPDHAHYLTEFCTNFINDVIGLIDRGRNETKNIIRTAEYYSYYNEVLHHLHFCKLKCQTFCGQEDILEQVRKYVTQSTTRTPLVIHAESGAGKTSIMAMVMSRLKKWIKGDYTAVIRFLGTSPQTQDIYQTLFYTCGQIADDATIILEPVAYKNMKSLVSSLPRMLRALSVALKEPIVILLDSLDQLTPANDAYSCNWLPTTLPPNVYLVVSTLTREHGILDNLKKKLPDSCFLQVPILPQDTGREIVKTCLKAKSRVLSEEQTDHVLKHFVEVPNPLYLKILVDEAAKWPSYRPLDDCKLANSVKGAIQDLFSRLDYKFGSLLVQRALGYLTVGLNGLSEIELEDVLSCDDEVLSEVYKYHDPPVPGTVRIPPVLWARIHFEIKEYLVERLSQGKTTLHWYHRQFIETATERFVAGAAGTQLHEKLYLFFQPEDGVRREIKLAKRNITIPDADRQIAQQPLDSRNTRKLECMAYHALRAAREIGPEVLKRDMFCNLRYLHAVITAFSVDKVLETISNFLREVPGDEEVTAVKNFLEISHGSLRNILVFSGLLLAYMKAAPGQTCLETLRLEARATLEGAAQPLLIPEFPCLAARADGSVTDASQLQNMSDLLASGEGWLLLKYKNASEEDPEASVKPFCLYNKASQELSTLDVTQGALVGRPKVSRDGETCLMASPSSLLLLKPPDCGVQESPVAAILGSSGGKSTVAAFTLSADATHCVFATADRKLVLCSVPGFKKVAEFEQSNPLSKADVHSIVCTSGSSPTIVTAGLRTSKTERMGVLSLWQPGSSKSRANRETSTLMPDILGLAEDDQHVLCVCNKEESGKVVIYPTAKMDDPVNLEMEGRVSKLLVSQTQPSAAALVGDKCVKVIDLNAKAVTTSAAHPEPIADLFLSVEEDVLVVVDSKGVTLYSPQDGACKATMETTSSLTCVTLMQEHVVTMDSNQSVMLCPLDDVRSGKTTPTSADSGDTELNADPLVNVTVKSFCLSNNSQEVIAGCSDGTLKIFSLSYILLNTINIGIKPDFLYMTDGQLIVAHDKSSGQVKVIDLSGNERPVSVPHHVMSVAVMADGKSLVALSRADKALSVHQVELETGVNKKSLTLPPLGFVDINITLCPSERYAVLKVLLSEEERNAIIAAWKKHSSNHLPHPHSCRLVAVDLQSTKGNYLACCRPLTKIPSLMEVVEPFSGNTVVISSRRHCVFWDIPTGKADLMMSKVKKQTKMYRPDWCGGDKCVGINTCYAQTRGHDFLAVGSQDGYLIVYGAESGLPRGMATPTTRHRAEVVCAAASPDGKTVASVCKNGVLKLWSSASGMELFSTGLRLEIKTVSFTPDSLHLVLLSVPGAKGSTRLLVFKLHNTKA